eukprot:gene36257-47184_t
MDEFVGLEWDNPSRPEATNLLNIYRAVSGKSREDIQEQVKDRHSSRYWQMRWWSIYCPYKREWEVVSDEVYLQGVLRDGQQAADEVAEKTLNWAKDAMGILPPLHRSTN